MGQVVDLYIHFYEPLGEDAEKVAKYLSDNYECEPIGDNFEGSIYGSYSGTGSDALLQSIAEGIEEEVGRLIPFSLDVGYPEQTESEMHSTSNNDIDLIGIQAGEEPLGSRPCTPEEYAKYHDLALDLVKAHMQHFKYNIDIQENKYV